MTPLLKQAWSRIECLPEREQDEIAQIIIDELDDDELWREKFANSQDALAKLGDQAMKAYREGNTLPLDPDNL